MSEGTASHVFFNLQMMMSRLWERRTEQYKSLHLHSSLTVTSHPIPHLKLNPYLLRTRLNEFDPAILQALLQLISGQTAQQLPARILRYGVDELDARQPLVLRFMVRDVLHHHA